MSECVVAHSLGVRDSQDTGVLFICYPCQRQFHLLEKRAGAGILSHIAEKNPVDFPTPFQYLPSIERMKYANGGDFRHLLL